MTIFKGDKRKLHSLRKHIDKLLASGATIVQRAPLTLHHEGQTHRVEHGMLVSHSEMLDLVDPIADHEWPEALRKMAAELCLRQLDQALRATVEDVGNQPAIQGHATLRPVEFTKAMTADRSS